MRYFVKVSLGLLFLFVLAAIWPVVAQENGQCIVSARDENVNLRGGPSIDFGIVGILLYSIKGQK